MKVEGRRSFLSRALAISAATASPLFSAAAGSAGPESGTQLPSLKGRKILFTHGGWDGHEPEKFVAFLTPWMQQEGAEVVLSDNLDSYSNKSLMSSIDLVIQIFTMSQITNEQEAGLLEAVEKNGTGMAGWHGGMCDAFRNNPAYHYMTGGQWAAHPGGIIDYEVTIVDHKDAITRGLNDFSMRSEQYYMHVDPNVKVLATTQFNGAINSWIDGCVMPVAWKKMYGKGRIFYTSLGHNLNHMTDKPEALSIIKRGIQWASASRYESAERWMTPVYAK